MAEKRYDVIIIGAGIAGLTAAIYATRANKTVLILEEKTFGGQIITSFKIENWPGDLGISGMDLMKKIYHHANNLGAEIRYEKVVEARDLGEIKEIKTEEGAYTTKNIIIATGTADKELGLPREDEFVGRGISYCATCDGAFYKDKNVIVIGGGNSAIHNALYLSDIAKKVVVVHRRNEFRAEAALLEKLRAKKNVEFLMNSKPTKILGDGKLEGLEVEDLDGKKMELKAEGVFVAIGKKPATAAFVGLVKLDENGYVVAGEDCKTGTSGVFVAGDCRTKDVRQLITAAADGAVAANAAS